MSRDDADSEGFCESCHYGPFVKSYHYKPEPIFYKDKKAKNNNLYIGVELEVETSEVKSIWNIAEMNETDFIYFKKDGSVYDGVEIVSHPANYEYHRFKEWKEIFRQIYECGFNNCYGNAGLHFHINRDWFTKDALKNFDYIINNCQGYMEKKGGRIFNSYCITCRKPTDGWGYSSGIRMAALNLQNQNTVEVRFCKSTLKWHVFIERLKFIYAMLQYAKEKTFEEILKKDMFKIENDIENIIKTLK